MSPVVSLKTNVSRYYVDLKIRSIRKIVIPTGDKLKRYDCARLAETKVPKNSAFLVLIEKNAREDLGIDGRSTFAVERRKFREHL